MAKRYSKAAHSKRRKQTSHVLKNTVILLFCAVGIWFGSSLWHAALTLQTAQPAESIAGEEFRPQVGDPPYRVVIDAGHGGADPGARGVIEEKDMTAATASELIRLLQQPDQFRGGCCGHIFFFDHSPCTRVCSTVPSIDHHAVRRITDLRTEFFTGDAFRWLSCLQSQRCMPE